MSNIPEPYPDFPENDELDEVKRGRHKNWDRIRVGLPEELVGAIEKVGLEGLIIPEPENSASMTWHWTDFISHSEGNPNNPRCSMCASNYRSHWERFYERGENCIGKIALTSGPLFTHFGAKEIGTFQNLVGVLSKGLE